MLKIDIRQDGTKGVIDVEGELIVQSAGEFRDAMARALRTFDEVYVNVERVTTVDVSCFQLLCSAHRTAVRNKKSLSCSGNLPEEFRKSAMAAGYIRNSGCAFDCSNVCMWVKKMDAINKN
jgi:anti-anti-sigma regulatory factor